MTDRFHRMLCLIEPAIAEQDSGITFDPNGWTFKYPPPDTTGDGVAAIAAVPPNQRNNGKRKKIEPRNEGVDQRQPID